MANFPVTQFLQFDKDTDPSGVRHLESSAIKSLDTSITGCLDFGNANTTTSGAITNTTMQIFRVSDLGDASGVYNMRFFLQSATAFGAGNYRFLHKINTHYQGVGFTLGLADLDIPLSKPTSANVLSTTNEPPLSGITDAHVSQYIYLAVFVDTDVPFGTYGGCANGSFRYRMIYDFS
jgi:hypothetical protein